MSTKPRSPGQTAISVSLSEELKYQITDRARSLGLSVSQYLCRLAANDLASPGPLVVHPAPMPGSTDALVDAVLRRLKQKNVEVH